MTRILKFEKRIDKCEDCPYRKYHHDMDGAGPICKHSDHKHAGSSWYTSIREMYSTRARSFLDEKPFPDHCPLKEENEKTKAP